MTAFDAGKKSKTGYPGRALPKPEKVKDAREDEGAARRAAAPQILETAISAGPRRPKRKKKD